MAEELRTLDVDGARYSWRVTHRHTPAPTSTGRLCVDKFLAFREGTSNAPLRISFAAGPGGGSEYIQRHGEIFVVAPRVTINLHRPRAAAAIIRRALELGWSAEAPMTVDDGFGFLSALPPAVLTHIAEPHTLA